MWPRGTTRIAAATLLLALPLLGNTATGGFETRVLEGQNRERAALGIAPLQWNAELARTAQRWADHLAATGTFAHAAVDPRRPLGENLWAGTRGQYSPEAMVDAWVREKRNYKPGTFPDNSLTGRVGDVGHYTQMMWRSTGQVGCALATGSKEDILVCRYSDAGNWVGERPF